MDDYLLRETARATHERTVQRQRGNSQNDGGPTEADDAGLDDVHESTAVPLPTASARGSCESVGGIMEVNFVRNFRMTLYRWDN